MNNAREAAGRAASPTAALDHTRIEVDLGQNTIAVDVPETARDAVAVPGDALAGTLDIGARGRLIGLEIEDHYIEIATPEIGAEHLTRSIAVALTTHRGRDGHATTVSFRRSGDNYEISFPSGNQCWEVGNRGAGGRIRVCSTLVS